MGRKAGKMAAGDGKLILETGGAGYIGSHCCLELLAVGYDVVVVDNFCNSSPESLKRVMEITGKTLEYHEADVRDTAKMREIFESLSGKIYAVIHFAALKAVGESGQKPLEYYENNVAGALALLRCMKDFNVNKIVFSSSATVYGMNATSEPMKETSPISATNPYGRTKLYIEEMLRDIAKADPQWRVVNLRYFNPTGVHQSVRIGEDPAGIPN